MELGEIDISTNLSESLSNYLTDKRFSKLAVLVDEHTKQLCYPLVADYLPEHIVIEIESGEEHKQIETCLYIWQVLTDNHFDRKSLFINLGGGVIGDMGGFCAATYKRGIPFINLPTTLLAQVDASVGGKLGIDFQKFKNHIGYFKSPEKVIIFEGFLSTLPYNELRSGFAEVIKHHLIRDGIRWNSLMGPSLEDQPWKEVISHSIAIKKQVVHEDPHENGVRKILNFGHTIGHAVESYFLDIPNQRLLHGEAIAVGMIAENFLSVKLAGLTHSACDTINQYLIDLYHPVAIQSDILDLISALALHDKKNLGTTIKCTLLESIGKACYDVTIDQGNIVEALKQFNDLILQQNKYVSK